MFPLRDENPTELTPYVTFVLIGVNVIVWLLVQGMGQGQLFIDSLCTYGSIPGEITGQIPVGTGIDLGGSATCEIGGPRWATMLTSMFMHGGWMHLVGNMWFLWVFGNNIEDSMGHIRYVAFYLLTGILASTAHILAGPGSGIPTVGASGAIAGVMGAYLVLYPKVKIKTLLVLIIYIRIIPVAAWLMLIYWLVIQIVSGAGSIGVEGGGVAFWAHVGGFVAGAALIKPFERHALVDAKRAGKTLSREEVRDLGWF